MSVTPTLLALIIMLILGVAPTLADSLTSPWTAIHLFGGYIITDICIDQFGLPKITAWFIGMGLTMAWEVLDWRFGDRVFFLDSRKKFSMMDVGAGFIGCNIRIMLR